MNLNLSTIQHFSVGDGDGIRTTVFLQGCNLHCPWCHNPETIPVNGCVLSYPDRTVVSGRTVSLDEIVTECLEDIDFYGEDGGVTISGGEPLLQARGVADLCEKLGEKGVNVVLDTAGNVPFSAFEVVEKRVKTFFFDVKTADKAEFAAIGGDLDLVGSNLSALIRNGDDVVIRIPVIPGYGIMKNDENEAKMVDFLRKCGGKRVDLLPFHRLGSGKYRAVGKEYAFSEVPSMKKEALSPLRERLSKYFSVRLEG